jgi:hypothetical protein
MRMNVSVMISYVIFGNFSSNKKVIKNTINDEQRGRVLSWEKHRKVGVQRELEAAIRGARNLPENEIGPVHNFQDVLTVELEEYVPGSAYFRRRAERNLPNTNGYKKKMTQGKFLLSNRIEHSSLYSHVQECVFNDVRDMR